MSKSVSASVGQTAPPASDRAPRFSIKPTGFVNGLDELVLPRPYYYPDGDGTNATITVGLNVGTKYTDPFLSFGLNVVIPPRLFWLLDLLRIG